MQGKIKEIMKLIQDVSGYPSYPAEDIRGHLGDILIDNEYFVITRVHRDDIKSVFGKEYYDAIDNIPRVEMEWLARKMGDDYVGQLFWYQIEILANDMVKGE